MDIIFSDDFLKQLDIIKTASENGNIDFQVLYARIGVAIKSLSTISSIDDIPFKLRYHDGNNEKIGHLGYPLDDCLSLDIDRSNRFLTFELLNNAVIITSLGHYNVLLGRDSYGCKSWLFEPPENQVNNIVYCSVQNVQDFKRLKERTQPAIDVLLKKFNEFQINSDLINKFNASMAYDLCPIGVDSITIRLNSYLRDNDSNFRRPDGSFDSKQRDQTISRFLKDNALLLKRATLNARCLSNSVAKTIGNGDLKNALFTKLDLEKKLIRDFADFIYFCNGKIQSPSVKKEVFDLCVKAFLKGYDQEYDNIVEFKNSRIGSFDYRNDYEIIKRLNVYLRKTIEKDLISCIKSDKKCYIRTIFKKNSDELFATLTPNADLLIKVFRKNCRKLNLNRYGKSRENHELICKKLGLKAGSLLKTKESDIVHKQHKKKGIKR